ncbi:uncharacterized protein STEHIDRAFT_69944 [Stereum hirsutum FP-91666 SS1]|uniref:Uncharacterized protein n=1 Tax=Stereum hirsutum (strain FP-91666) TaxID=721885 RepID=R7RWC4_STEHR|nr:uncharacterized protein STEHIDRAFT_69944 [Stereum hirsutum FP-91666 SS1]EIM79075.1 hypothetical protein STEHIDRAFT_69944 [Stereum hirsutum FP-91666 SS1]
MNVTQTTDISKSVAMDFETDKASYKLAGVIYYGDYHFTARLVDKQRTVWSYDGMQHNGVCIQEAKLKDMSSMATLGNRTAAVAIYSSL